MALIKCPHCGKQVSERATVCPHCNQSLQQTTDSIPWWIMPIVLAVALIGIIILIIVLNNK